MKKVMLVFGTRPEAIKMCPIVVELFKRKKFEIVVCVTGQHKQMLETVMNVFEINPNYNLEIMKDRQNLYDITINILERIENVLIKENPDIVLVHGDTTTTFATALACFYSQIPIGHVEAGLRTYNLLAPYPEEFNRQVVGIVTNYHFAPTEHAKENLIKENKNKDQIYVTGNTAIDALKYTVCKNYKHEQLEWVGKDRLLLMTAHRRENIGEPMRNIFLAVKRIADEYSDVKIIYPIHMNPVIRELAEDIFTNCKNVHVIEPLDVIDFHNFLARSYCVLTDSGGIQEEAPALGKPVLVFRDVTERPEGVEAGTIKMVGTNYESIYQNIKQILDNKVLYEKMSCAKNPYGDGTASEKIVNILENVLLDKNLDESGKIID